MIRSMQSDRGALIGLVSPRDKMNLTVSDKACKEAVIINLWHKHFFACEGLCNRSC